MKLDIENKVSQAMDLHSKGYNCAQSVVMVFAEDLKLDRRLAEMMSASFGGGVAKMKEVCGCVSAMALLSGFIKENIGAEGRVDVMKTYDWTKTLADKFSNQCGDIVCKRLKGLEPGSTKPPQPCRELIATAVRLIGKSIVRN
ncbi:MAG: C-GCAxxG-C-C family protein [Bacteroidales bacterium]|nr:C-GCAxxG-C-C family protein [Bacteroidales bacterium]